MTTGEKTQSKTLSFEDFLNGENNKTKYLDIPVVGGNFRIVSLTAEELVEWTEFRNESPANRKLSNAWLMAKSMVDDNGKRIGDMLRLDKLIVMPVKTVETVMQNLMKFNGINQNLLMLELQLKKD